MRCIKDCRISVIRRLSDDDSGADGRRLDDWKRHQRRNAARNAPASSANEEGPESVAVAGEAGA